jgi:hypothetical protein
MSIYALVSRCDCAPVAILGDEIIGRDDELSHSDDEDDLCGFARLAQNSSEGSKVLIVATCGKKSSCEKI